MEAFLTNTQNLRNQIEPPKVLVALSGGIDSSTLVAFLLSLSFKVEAISFDYSQRHRRELLAAKEIASFYEIPHRELKLEFPETSALLNIKERIPLSQYSPENQKLTFVPNRNMVFLSILAAFAIGGNVPFIAYAAHRNDFTVYPDCRPQFIDACQEAIIKGNYISPTILAPFKFLYKFQIISLGLCLGVPYEKTWTCYLGGQDPCLRCSACRERLSAFHRLGMEDPLLR